MLQRGMADSDTIRGETATQIHLPSVPLPGQRCRNTPGVVRLPEILFESLCIPTSSFAQECCSCLGPLIGSIHSRRTFPKLESPEGVLKRPSLLHFITLSHQTSFYKESAPGPTKTKQSQTQKQRKARRFYCLTTFFFNVAQAWGM